MSPLNTVLTTALAHPDPYAWLEGYRWGLLDGSRAYLSTAEQEAVSHDREVVLLMQACLRQLAKEKTDESKTQ
jgi:hypothetical protein